MTLFQSNNKLSIDSLKTNLKTIESKIPVEATPENQLVDKAYVDTSLSDHISSLTASFNGSYATYADLVTTTGMNRNDYAVVLADENHSGECWRYKYDGITWRAEYRVNETALTTEQNNALNSGITAEVVSNLSNIVPITATSDNKLVTAKDILSISELMSNNVANLNSNFDTKMDKKNPTGTGNFSFNGGNPDGASYSLSLGRNSVTSQLDSVVLGGYNGHATANSAVVLGGENNYATGVNSLATGLGNYAVSDHQSVVGRYNLYSDDSNQIPYCFFVVGNGTSDKDRSNAFGVSYDGNVYVKGNIYVNCDEKLANGTSLSDFISKNSSLKFTGVLTVGQTSLVIENDQITDNMMINVYTSVYGINPKEVIVKTGKVTINFENSYEQDITVGIKLESF